MPNIAFFDVDKTLIKGYSGFYTTLVLIQRGVLKKRRLPQALYYRLLSPFYEGGGPANLKKLYQIAVDDMAGWHMDDILKIGRECFERWIRPRIYAEGVEKIQEHKAKGDSVYLVTSGPSMTIRILAEFLGASGQYSAGPVINSEGVLTSVVQMPIYYREGKIAAAQEVVGRVGARWEDCHFYSDSIDDIFLLEKVGHPHLVNPDDKLQRVGKERDWPMLRFSRLLGKENGHS